MTIICDNDNEVLLYALERIINYARNNQYILIAQCVWWVESTIGLESKSVEYIDNSRIRLQASQTPIKEESRIDRTNTGLEQRCDEILNQAERFINGSKKQKGKDLVGYLRRTQKVKLLPAKMTKRERKLLNQLIQVSPDQVRCLISS